MDAYQKQKLLKMTEGERLDLIFELLSDAWSVSDALQNEAKRIQFKTSIDVVRNMVTAYEAEVEELEEDVEWRW